MQHKTCAKCHESFPETTEFFGRSKGYKNGFRSRCRKCLRADAIDYRSRNYEEVRERETRWRRENPEKVKKHASDYYRRNPEKCKEWMLRWREENPDKLKEGKRQYYERSFANPMFRLSSCMSGGIQRSLKGRKNGRSWESLVGYTFAELKAHLESQFKKGMTWENYGKWHVDHIRPIFDFSYSSPNDLEFKECWSLWNLQPLWAEENLKKNNKCDNPPLPLCTGG